MLYGWDVVNSCKRFSAFVVILHCGSSGREHMLARWRREYLDGQRHILASDHTDLQQGLLGFPDDPGKPGTHFVIGGGKYIGAHRPLTAILFANDTWGRAGGGFDWILQGDDDTRFSLASVAGTLDKAGAKPTTPR